jgi:hypothetical protein
MAAAGLLLVLARARAGTAACPACGSVSGRVHSRYVRRLADAAIGGRRVVIQLTVRRLFCADPGCKRRTFAEQVPGLTVRYARKTPPLRGMLRDIAVALAGRAASRLAAALGMPASRQVLLRLVMAAPDPAAPVPRVLGVDDFAIRRGQNYGTVIIDCETGAPLDLLEGRDAQPLADWLAAHPGVEVICRDRSGAYADGARTGAPQAVQVADRFHLWQNLAKAVERCVAAHRSCLAEPDPAPAGGEQPVPSSDPADTMRPEPAGKYADRARRHHALVHELLDQGRGLREIARHLGWACTPSSATPAPPPGRNSPTDAGRDRVPASWTRSSPTWTSAPVRAAATAPSCSGKSGNAATPAATPSSAATLTSTVPPGRRYPRHRRPSGTSPAGSSATRTPSPRATGPGSRPCWTAAPNSGPPRTRSARLRPCSPSSPARTSRTGSAKPAPPACPASPPSPTDWSRTSTPSPRA